MLNEDQLEKIAIQWFQDTGWRYAHGKDVSPDSDTPVRGDKCAC